MMQEATQHLYQ